MKFSFLWATYRDRPLSAFLYGLLCTFVPILDFMAYFNQDLKWLPWSPVINSTLFNMIHHPYFWWIMLFNLIPFLCLLLIKQQWLMLTLAIWICGGFIFYLINNYTAANYPLTSLLVIGSGFSLIRSHNKKLMFTY